MNRRDFLKHVYKIGGTAALMSMGVVNEARSWGVLPGLIGSAASPGVSFETWDEKTQSGWIGMDSTKNFIVIHDGGDASDDIGEGAGLTFPDTVLSQAGAIPVAVNNSGYYYRSLDGTGDYFTVTTNFRDFLVNATTYTLMWCVENWDHNEANESLIYWDTANDDFLVRKDGNTPAALEVKIQNTDLGATVDTIDPAKKLYIAVWSDNVNVRGGFAYDNKPSKLTDFEANKVVTNAGGIQLTSMDEGVERSIYRAGGAVQDKECKLRAYWFLMSTECLIEN